MFIFVDCKYLPMGQFNDKTCKRILRTMEEKNFRRSDLAAGLGITYNQCCNLLTGRCMLNVDKINTIADILDVPIVSLL